MKRKHILAAAGGIAAILVAGALAALALSTGGNFTPQQDTYTFVCDLRDGPCGNIASEENSDVRLDTLFSEENMQRWGADGDMPDGVGLHTEFRTVIGSRTLSTVPFDIPKWEFFEQEDNPIRNGTVRKKKKSEFETLASGFKQGPVGGVKFVHVIVLDTTSGVTPALESRVRATIGACTAGTIVLAQLSNDWYQGEPPVIDCAAPDETKIATWFSARSAESSSILGGLRGVFADVVERIRKEPNIIVDVTVFTDGLEYSDTLDFYGKPELVRKRENWPTLDAAFGIGNLDLKGVLVIIRPLPVVGSEKPTMEASHGYIAERVTAQGATAEIRVN